MKTCTNCGETKPLADYYKHAHCKMGVHPECKACFLERDRARRARDREKIRERDRERYRANPEPKKTRARAYYAANREEQITKRREHYAANKETYAAYSAARKALKRGVERQPYTRREIYDRDGGRCRICSVELPYAPNAFHLDHIVPLSLGGPDAPANLQLTCPGCNREKWANLEGQIHLPV